MKRGLIITAAILLILIVISYIVDLLAVKLLALLVLAAAAYIFFLIQKKQTQKALDAQKSFYELKMNMLKTSLDPHFLFNAINSVSYSIHKNDSATASNNLTALSKLMRTSLTSIDSFGHELSEEVTFVRNYLTLEKFRFINQFDFTIKVMPYVNEMAKVPSFCIFCYVENALKKGVLAKREPGSIELTIDEDKTNNALAVRITDDGAYRDLNSGEIPSNIKIINELFDRLNAANDSRISVSQAANGKTDGQPSGCVVDLRIPLDLSYSLSPAEG